ncbi:hypothetical protein BD413DRAFT_514026 [Trametes elegans]|nr:hypothetical protein BD413DRAFT_514026 [Trametes elegans]
MEPNRQISEHGGPGRRPVMAVKSARKKEVILSSPLRQQDRTEDAEIEQRGSDASRKIVVPTASTQSNTAGGSQSPISGDRPWSAANKQVLRATKQPGNQPRPPLQQSREFSRSGHDRDNVPRKLARKSASIVSPSQQKRTKSSFNYIAPLRLRGAAPPTKSTPSKPAYLELQERLATRAPQARDRDELLEIRNAPRKTLAAMSVQRRAVVSPRKGMIVPRTPIHPRGEAPSRLLHRHPANEISTSSSEESDADRRPPFVLVSETAARKTQPESRLAAKGARKRSDLGDRLVAPLGKAARKRDIAPVHDIIEISDSDDDISELLEAYDALTLGTARLQKLSRLPFHLPNLRVGFADRCRRAGVPTEPVEKPDGVVKVIYRYYPEGFDAAEDSSGEEECQEWVGSMTDWRCPLCQLHKPFNTMAMLNFHLKRDHEQVRVSWSESHINKARRWRITLVLPDYDELDDSTSEEESDSEAKEAAAVKDELEDREVEETVLRGTNSSIVSQASEPLFLPDLDEPSPARPSSPIEPVDMKPKILRRSPSPEEGPHAEVNPISDRESRQKDVLPERKSYRGTLPSRYPSPPPPTDPLGPAAQYPFLPEVNAEGHAAYSCRIGGPRLFDLLNDLPLDEFGILSWAIVDREEELFEMGDVRDEDKVMLALWNRWIMLNKSAFIFDKYLNGIQKFLDRYWKVIHQAAGWRALRAFLLMMHANHYLSVTDVRKALQYYEEKTGMELWYKEEEGDETDVHWSRIRIA